jgi:hypothetical protein
MHSILNHYSFTGRIYKNIGEKVKGKEFQKSCDHSTENHLWPVRAPDEQHEPSIERTFLEQRRYPEPHPLHLRTDAPFKV